MCKLTTAPYYLGYKADEQKAFKLVLLHFWSWLMLTPISRKGIFQIKEKKILLSPKCQESEFNAKFISAYGRSPTSYCQGVKGK